MSKSAQIEKDKPPFAQVFNDVLYDENLSFKAKGLYAYITAKPDKWDFSCHRIVSETKDGVRSTQSGLQELEKAGYLVRDRQKNGRVKYFLTFNPASKNKTNESLESSIKEDFTDISDSSSDDEESKKKPDVRNVNETKPHNAKTATIRNKDIKEIKSSSRTLSETTTTFFEKIGLDKSNIQKAVENGLCEIDVVEIWTPAIKSLPAEKQNGKYLNRFIEENNIERAKTWLASSKSKNDNSQRIEQLKTRITNLSAQIAKNINPDTNATWNVRCADANINLKKEREVFQNELEQLEC